MFTLLGPETVGTPTPLPSFRRVWLLERLSIAFVSQPRLHGRRVTDNFTCRRRCSDWRVTGVRPVRGRAPAHRRTSGGRAVSGAAEGRRRIGRNQLGGRELGPAVSQASRSSHQLGGGGGIQIHLPLLLPQAAEAKPTASPRDLVLGLDRPGISVNTTIYICSSLSFSMKSVLYKGVMDAGEHAA